MNREILDRYKEDQHVVQFGENDFRFFFNANTKTVIEFGFFHSGLEDRLDGKIGSRIIFRAYDLNNYPEGPPLVEFGREQYVLANSDEPNYAMVYKIMVDEEAEMAYLTLHEYPELGRLIISDDEKNGIAVPLRKA